jgi:hypothetical protein
VSEKLPERLILITTSQNPDIRRFGMLPVSFHIRFLTLNQFMDLCDKLEAGLVQAQTEGGDLMEAVVHQL